MKAKAFVVIPTKKDEITIAPLVICKYCKHYRDNGASSQQWLPCQDMSVPENWFCASGEEAEERKSDN